MKNLSAFIRTACVTAGLLSAMGSSTAAQLTTTGGSFASLIGISGDFNPNWLGGESLYSAEFDLTSMLRGANLGLSSAAAGVTFTLVGFEAGFNNAFLFGGQRLNNRANSTPLLGESLSFASQAQGSLNYGFLSNGLGNLFGNGSSNTGVILSRDRTSALLLFNDTYIDADFDDMVVRLNVSPVPEPETFAMLLGGLGLIAAAMKRRRQQDPGCATA
jgi:hypothetical protein